VVPIAELARRHHYIAHTLHVSPLIAELARGTAEQCVSLTSGQTESPPTADARCLHCKHHQISSLAWWPNGIPTHCRCPLLSLQAPPGQLATLAWWCLHCKHHQISSLAWWPNGVHSKPRKLERKCNGDLWVKAAPVTLATKPGCAEGTNL